MANVVIKETLQQSVFGCKLRAMKSKRWTLPSIVKDDEVLFIPKGSEIDLDALANGQRIVWVPQPPIVWGSWLSFFLGFASGAFFALILTLIF